VASSVPLPLPAPGLLSPPASNSCFHDLSLTCASFPPSLPPSLPRPLPPSLPRASPQQKSEGAQDVEKVKRKDHPKYKKYFTFLRMNLKDLVGPLPSLPPSLPSSLPPSLPPSLASPLSRPSSLFLRFPRVEGHILANTPRFLRPSSLPPSLPPFLPPQAIAALEKDKLDVGIADMDPEELIPLQEEAAKEEEKVRGRE